MIIGGWRRQHHDFQREGQSVYYSPDERPKINSGKTLILGHRTIHNPLISDKKLLDDVVYEVDWAGKVLWQWSIADHFSEFGFDEAAKNVLARNPNMRAPDGGVGDFMHTNCVSYLGPNHWYDAGDQRFKPTNLILDSREANVLFIVDHDSGHIVWQLGPDYVHDAQAAAIGQIIGQHSLHMIPQGLPGAGNLLVFDNGGWAGYGTPNPGSLDGAKNALRDYSRILELNPVTMKVVWSVTPQDLGFNMPVDSSKFYSPYVSNVQRLPNGNTLIDEGSDGHVFELTPDYEVVWEWISPYFTHNETGPKGNMIYRAFRYPYSYVPQEPTPTEVPIAPVDNTTFRLPGAGQKGAKKVVSVAGTLPYYPDVALCVATLDETNEVQALKKQRHLFTLDRKTFSELDQTSFAQQIQAATTDQLQIVMFGAERCAHCKVVHPLLKRALTTEFAADFTSYYVDVDANPELVVTLGILGTPVVIVFSAGSELTRFRGELDYAGIRAFLSDTLVKAE